MITAISMIKTTIKTHIAITRLATRGALIALFAGLFILAACGGGGGGGGNDVVDSGGGSACTNPFAPGCGPAGGAARASAITACRLLIEDKKTCADTVPDAVLACLTDPYACDADAYNTAIGTKTATVLIETLRTARTDSCRLGGGTGRAGGITSDLLCDGAIDNTCLPISRATDASRNQLIFDNLCNNAPKYTAARQDFITDCTDFDLFNNVGCTTQITTCTTAPFGANCRSDVYAGQRAQACRGSTPDARCAAENILATYCTANPFGVTAGCLTDDAFDGVRIAECTMGNNGAQERCKDTARFTDNTLIACFTDPYGTDCEGITGYNVTNARANRKTYCIGLGEGVVGESLCDTAVSSVCTGDDANIFDPICFADNYQIARETACRATDLNSRDARCPATVEQVCADNPFTQTLGGAVGYLCTGAANATARAALVARCTSENGDKTGCNAGIGNTNLSICIDDPYAGGCGDVAFNDLKTERYNHCISGAPTKNCTGTILVVCTDDRPRVQRLANPFHALCRGEDGIAGLQNSFCRFRQGERPECVTSRTSDFINRNFINACIANPFLAACLARDSFGADRAVIIADCLEDTPANPAKCDLTIDGTITVAMCITDPFANGCSTNTGFDATRDARTALCSASGTPFDSLCDNFAERDRERTTHCTTERTSFTDECDDPAYPNTDALQTSFCSKTANRFDLNCAGNSGVAEARTALALLCFTNAEAEGCDQFANGVDGATVAQCSADLYSVAKGCPSNESFDTLRDNRTTLCQTPGAGQDPFNSLCDNFPNIDGEQTTFCSSGAGSFNMNCALNYPDETVTGRRAFALSCRTPPRAPACATTIVAGSVTVADCIENPYQRACYGTANNRNLDFIDEVAARDVLCRNEGDIYDSLCLNSAGMEIVVGIIAAREAGCTASAQSAFNPSCVDKEGKDVYAGVNAARRNYCSTLDTVSGEDILDRCPDYSDSICGTEADANPFAAICTTNGRDNSVNQRAFCGSYTNPQCTNDATKVCPDDPFNVSAGIDGTVNCLMESAYVNDRAERCAAGTQGTGECNEPNSVTRVCLASGNRANPFASFCATADDVVGDLDVSKKTFADACAGASPSVYCETSDVQAALCSSRGEFVRPFANTCAGSVGIGARVSFCGTGDNVTSDSRCNDNNIIVSVCRTDPFSTACETSAGLVFEELRELRAKYCETSSLDDVLCTRTAADFICRDGYAGIDGRVGPNLLSGVCTQPIYADNRRAACLRIISESNANPLCDDITEVTDACRENPFDTRNPGCAFISQAGDLQSEYCQGENTWQDVCDVLAKETEGVNEVATARVNACLNLTSGVEADCKALSSVGEACEATPFADGCIIFTGAVLDGYEKGYCETLATAWHVGCDELDAAGDNMVSAMRSSACNDATQVDDAMAAGFFSPRCNTLESFGMACSSDPFDSTTPGCAFHEDFEDLAANYCTASGTTWQDACDMRAEEEARVNDVFRARHEACVTSVNAAAFPDTDCVMIATDYCDDTENSANAFSDICGTTGYDTNRGAQLDKACAEGGTTANTQHCDSQVRAVRYCQTRDNYNPYAGIGCNQIADIETTRMTYCALGSNLTTVLDCSADLAIACPANPFNSRCIDTSDTTYADLRKTRANECRAGTKSGDECSEIITACNDRPFGATDALVPTTGTATTCSSDPAFVDARADLVTKCIVVNAVNDDPDCENAVADQKEVDADDVSCLENPYSSVINCEHPTQLGSAPNVMTARASFCRTTTGSNSFSGSCDSTNADIKKAQSLSCLNAATPVDLNSNCPTLITNFCTATTGVSAFNDLCRGETGNATARATLCANGADDDTCTETGASFTAWTKADEADTDADILDAGEAVNDDPVANFIKGVLNADGKLHVKKGVATSLEANVNLASSYGDATLRGDAEDGFAFATADVGSDSTHRLYVGILHTTDLGAPITTDTGKALWKGVIRALRYASSPTLYDATDFVLSIDFSTRGLVFVGTDGGVTLDGGDGATLKIITASFDAGGLITGSVSLINTAQNGAITGTLRGFIGEEGAVGVFASPTAGTASYGHFVGGFVASAVDRVAVCPIETNPFGEGCNRVNDTDVLDAQFLACSIGARPDNLPVKLEDCNNADLSLVICDDDIALTSKADPFAEICTEDEITMKTTPTDFASVRATVRTHCEDVANVLNSVCMARAVQLARLNLLCVATDESTLFGERCNGYSEYAQARALACRKRESGSSLICGTPEIIGLVCNASTGEQANPFDAICSAATHGEARRQFATRCARDFANDPGATSDLRGADCSNTGLNSVCLDDPFSTGCNTNEDYVTVRSDRIDRCRGVASNQSTANQLRALHAHSATNIFGYNCSSAIIEVCGSPRTTEAPKDAVLFNDNICMNAAYDARRAAIVAACVAANDPTNENCEFETVAAVTRTVVMRDNNGAITGTMQVEVSPAKTVGECIASPYDVKCLHDAFDDTRTAVLGVCDIATFASMSTTGVDCVAVQTSVCGGGVYADNPFDAFCDKKDAANNDATIDANILASQRIRYCQDSTNRAANADCETFTNRATTLALLDAQAQSTPLGKSPNTVSAENEFLQGTADGLNTGGFIEKNGKFASVRTLNLKTATHNGAALDGDVADGVAYFAGRRHNTQGDITTDVNYYVGIHSGTDLGNPLPRQYGQDGADLEVNWNGRIGWLVYDSVNSRGYESDISNELEAPDGVLDFTLTVNLTDRSIRANIIRTAVLSSPHGFFLQGTYDENGVIKGIARYGAIDTLSTASTALYNGFLIGLIGAEGAVGAFHLTESGVGAVGGASGGFVASASAPGSGRIEQTAGSINYWIVEREDEGENAINVLETSEEINKDNPDVNFIIGSAKGERGIAMVDAQDQGTLEFSTGSSNGLSYGFADYGSGVEKFYVGLFSSTDVGTPLVQGANPTLSWDGLLAIAKQDNQGSETDSYLIKTEFTLLITFTGSGGTITTSADVGTRLLLPRSIYDTAGLKDEFVIAGTFDEFGLISGTTTYYANNGGTRTPLEGILTGLIGAQGVVGVFTSKASGADAVGHYVGGFVASPAFGVGGIDHWQDNAVEEVITGSGPTETITFTPIVVKAAGNAEQRDGDYTFIGGGTNTLDLGSATKSDTLTQDLTFDENLILDNGDVFSLNSDAVGGISFAQATVGGDTQYYAGLLANIFIGAPLQEALSVNWEGVISIIAGGDVPALYTKNFTLVINFSIKSVYSNTTFLRTLGNVNHDIELAGNFNDKGVIYGTATYQVGNARNVGLLSGLIGVNGAAAVFGGNAGDPGRFVGGLVAVPSGTTLLTPRSQFVWAEGIDETVFEGTRFNAGVASFSADDNTITWKEDDDDKVEIVTTDADAINVDTTFLGGVDNVDGTKDGFVLFKTTDDNVRIHHVGILSGTNLGRPVVNTGGVGSWSARMAGLVIAGSIETAFNTDFTLSVDFTNGTISADSSDMPKFVVAGDEFIFNFTQVEWNTGTGIFKSAITLTAKTSSQGTKVETGILRGIIGADGAIGTFKISEDPGEGGRTFIGGFVAVPESIGSRRGQPAYWAQYARNADNTAGLDVRGVREAKTGDGTYTVIEGGLETLELGLEVEKHDTLTNDLTFNNTDVSPDGSTLSLDPTVAGGISVATNAAVDKYYAGLLSGTDVGRTLTATPVANWLGRFGIIRGTTSNNNQFHQKDFELAIDFGAGTLKSFNPVDMTNFITFSTDPNDPLSLAIDGKFNDRGIIYGTTTYKFVVSSTPSSFAGVLTGLIGQKGAAAVFYSSTAIKYAGGFIAVPNRGDRTRVNKNPPASYSIWADDIDVTAQQNDPSRTAAATASDANSAAFTIEVSDSATDTNRISLNLAPFGGDAEDGVFGYADDTARRISLLSSTNLGGLLSDTNALGLPIYTGTATWEGVMQLIIGDGGAEGVVTQGFTLDVNFDTQALTFAGTTFTSNSVDYSLALSLGAWDVASGLFTGTINIEATGLNPQQISTGSVRGIIGKDGLAAAFRSTATAYSSFTGGFVATATRASETSFIEYFSSIAGGEVLDDFADGTPDKFARPSGNSLRLADGSPLAGSSVYRLGAGAVSSASVTGGSGFVVSTDAANLAVGILPSTDLGAPLPLTLAKTAEWTGKLYISNSPASLKNIVLSLDFAKGTIKTKTAVALDGGSTLELDGYFGLNPRALAARLPLGLLGGVVNYKRTTAPILTPLTLIGQIGERGVVGIFKGVVSASQLVGGFTALSSGTTANGREYTRFLGGALPATLDLAFGGDRIFDSNYFVKVGADGQIGGRDVRASHLFGLGGDNDPTTNPNGFTLGFGLSVSSLGNSADIRRLVTGIWASADLGQVLLTTEPTAIWTGTVQTLKVNNNAVGNIVGGVVESPFKIQVDFANRRIATAGADNAQGAVILKDCPGQICDTINFAGIQYNADGVIQNFSNPVQYTTNGTTYGLQLAGLIGQKGALGVFRGYFSRASIRFNRQQAPGIVGGFQVSPDPREVIVVPEDRVGAPKQLNYAAYLKYYYTDYLVTRHGPGVNAEPLLAENILIISQFLQGNALGTDLNRGATNANSGDHFDPFIVRLNGADTATNNGFVLASGGADAGLSVLSRYYAGLSSGADVGRYTDALASTTVNWLGTFYSTGFIAGTGDTRAPARFPISLTVDFGAGTIGTGGDFTLSQGHSVNIAGTFGTARGDENQGILGGFITYTGPNDDEAKRITRAPLYGIIGDAGALGVFAGGKYGADGDGEDSPLVGGFEVSPNPIPTANYALFYNYFLKRRDGLQLFNTVTKNSSILAGTATGLVQEGINDTTTCDDTDLDETNDCIKRLGYQTIRLGGNRRSNSGFAIMGTKTASEGRGYSYGGILSGTNLGAILPVSFGGGVTKAIWHGSFYVNGNKIERPDSFFETLLHHPLSLTVDLSAGTLRTVDLLGNLGTVALTPNSSVMIDGRFGLNATTADEPYGILLGDVRFDNTDYALIGLIGVDGAIGLFRPSGKQTTHTAFGGFEVSPPPPPAYGRGNYAVFEDFYRKRATTADRYLTPSISIKADTDQFVRGLRIGLVKHNLNGNLEAGSFAPLSVYLGGNTNSGSAFIIENFNGTHVVGLLGTTDLGFAPHENLATATWLGNFYVSNNVATTGTDGPAPFEIKSGVIVNFGAGTLTSTQETYTLANNQFISFGIYGKFGEDHELPLGILDGFVKYGHHETDAASIVTADLPLIGVIGRAGALGIFRDPSDNNLVGGFEAGISTDYDVFFEGARSSIRTGILISPSRHGSSSTSIQRSNVHEVNDAGTGLKAAGIKYDTTGTTPAGCCEWPTKPTGTQIAGLATGTKYGFGDDPESLSGFILAGTDVMTIPTNVGTAVNPHTQQTLRIVGAGFLKTSTLGAAILDITGSATWRGGKAYVLDTVDATTKVFNVDFTVNFAKGTFNTAGAVAVASKIGTDGTTVTDGQTGQTLLIEGKFGQGSTAFSAGFLTSGKVIYYNGAVTAVQTNALYGLIGRGGAVGIFSGGGQAGANNGYAGGFWVRPGATEVTTAVEVKYATYLSFYEGTDTGKNVVDSVNASTTPGTFVRFLNGAISGVATDVSTFRLGGANDADATNKDGLRFYVANNVKTVGLLGDTNLGDVLPNTTPSAIWYGRLFAKTDATAFSTENEKQIGLDVNFSEGTIDTLDPVRFTIGEQTHSVSIRGRFGLHDFVRRSSVPTATGLLTGFVEYTHYQTAAVRFPLIGIIGAEGVLGIFKGNVANVGLVGGFEVTPDTAEQIAARGPNHATYLTQFGGYINDKIIRNDDNVSQISLGEAHALAIDATAPNPRRTYRLGGLNSDANLHTSGQTITSGFALGIYTGDENASVGLLSGTNLGEVVSSNTPTATWAGRLYVNSDSTSADIQYAKLDLRVNFGEGTIETLAPISIVAYKADLTPADSVRKQTLEIKGRFGSHVDAQGLRTGTLGGSVIYNVGHYTVPNPITLLTDGLRARGLHHALITARFPLLGLIGEDGAIGVFHGTVSKAASSGTELTTNIPFEAVDVHIVGGFEVSPRAALPSTITASFERWARGATQCESFNQRARTIDFDTRCDSEDYTALTFIHPNDIFRPSDDLSGSTGARQGFVLGSTTTIGIDLTDALTLPKINEVEVARDIEILTLGGHTLLRGTNENTIEGTKGATVNSAGERFVLSSAMGTVDDGVAFIEVNGFSSSYAGILSSTDLGAPLSTSSTLAVDWPGTFAIVANGDTRIANDFVLNVNFATRRISWTEARADGYALQGRYDENGIITGIIKGKQAISGGIYFTGNLTGLIGAQGAVGAFVIDSGTRQRVGGFVAAPVAKISGTSYAHFEEHHGALTGERTLYPSSIAAVTVAAAFLAGTTDGAGLDTNGLTFRQPMGEFDSTAYKLGGDTNSPDGFALVNGALASGFDKRLRAGILSGTDLGPVISAEVNGLWTGTANVAYANSTTSESEFHSFTLNLEVDFAEGMINTVTDGVSGTDGLQVEGRFGVGNIAFNNGNGTALPPGILGGQVTYKFGVGGITDPELTILPLIGLIGGDGAIGVFTTTSGVFSYAGGFSAQPFALTDVGKTDPPAAIVVGVLRDYATLPTTGSATAGGFLKLGNTLTTTNISTFIPTDFTLTTDSIFTLRNDEEFTGGLAYFATEKGNDKFYYVGILADTNLGGPLTNVSGAAVWVGQFSEHRTVASADNEDFIRFHIDFGAGTFQFRNAANNGGDGRLVREGNTYALNGVFGNGIIDVNNNVLTTGQLGGLMIGAFGGTDRHEVPITGLIGAKGVLGTFVNTDNRSRFVGGFWAVPKLRIEDDDNDEVVNFTDWKDSFGRRDPLPSRITSPRTNTQNSEFLAGMETVVGENGLDDTDRTDFARVSTLATVAKNTIARFALDFGSDSVTYGDYPLGADATGGVAGFWQDSGDHRYAGLLSSTNVGAPINSVLQTGEWRGQFVAYRSAPSSIFTTRTDFKLQVGFNTDGTGGTLTMTNVADSQTTTFNSHYIMVGGKYDARGVISGTINYRISATRSTSGFLTGLIGADGVAGVFISGRGAIGDIDLNAMRSSNAADTFFGGFVATNKPLIDAPASPSANHEQFNWYYKNYGSGDRRLSSGFGDSGAAVKTAFLEGSGTGFLNTAGLARPSLTVVKLGGDDSSPNGFALVRGNVGGVPRDPAKDRWRAGLLSSTDLGAAFVTAPMLLTWTGSVHMLVDTNPVSGNGTFTLDFDTGALTSDVITVGTDTIQIMGEFEFGTNNPLLGEGILGGVASFTDMSTTTTAPLPLIGLIGTDGAIGVFHGAVGVVSVVGGFQAGPPPPRPCETAGNCVDYADWVASFGTDGVNESATSPLLESGFSNGNGNNSNYIKLTNDNKIVSGPGGAENLDTTPIRLNETEGQDGYESGFAYANDNINTTGQAYAGILLTTNLGAPLADGTKNGIWKGRLAGTSGYRGHTPESDDFSLQVTYGGTGLPTGSVGTIKSLDGDGAEGFVSVGESDSMRFIGDFNAAGVMWGSVNFNNAAADNGKFSGLIGAKGVVGVFEGSFVGATSLLSFHYAGGFVALPRPADLEPLLVNYADWIAVTTPVALASTPPTSNQFLPATGNDLDGLLIETKNLNLSTATNGGTALGGDVSDGIGYAAFVAGSNNIFVSGISSTTNLGAPLTSSTAGGTWKGSFVVGAFSGITPSFATHDLTLDVVFGSSTVRNMGQDTGMTIGSTDYSFTGTFDSRGVITGTTASTTNGAGVMQGLIGEQGAVGVFHSNAVGVYGGGFVACPIVSDQCKQ